MKDQPQSQTAEGKVELVGMGIRVIRANGTVEDWGRVAVEIDDAGNRTTRGAIRPPTLKAAVLNRMRIFQLRAREAIRGL